MEDLVISCLESRVEENRNLYARFLVGPFLKGDALTVATALRRVLLSSVESIGITALYIQGITHEFSTIVGVRESVLELSLNFGAIVLTYDKTLYQKKSFFDKLQIGYLQVQGPKVIYANHLKLPLGVKLVDPTQYIATVSKKGSIILKFIIGKRNISLNKTIGSESHFGNRGKDLPIVGEVKKKNIARAKRTCSYKDGSTVNCSFGSTLVTGASRHFKSAMDRLRASGGKADRGCAGYKKESFSFKGKAKGSPPLKQDFTRAESFERKLRVRTHKPRIHLWERDLVEGKTSRTHIAIARKLNLLGQRSAILGVDLAKGGAECRDYWRPYTKRQSSLLVLSLGTSFEMKLRGRVGFSKQNILQTVRPYAQLFTETRATKIKLVRAQALESNKNQQLCAHNALRNEQVLVRKTVHLEKQAQAFKARLALNAFSRRLQQNNALLQHKMGLYNPRLFVTGCSFPLRTGLDSHAKTTPRSCTIGEASLIEPDSVSPRQRKKEKLGACNSALNFFSKSNVFNSNVCLRNVIPLDLTLTPVLKVNFVVEIDDEVLYLRQRIRERIILEVWTNGSIDPRQAVHDSSLRLLDIFSSFRSVYQVR